MLVGILGENSLTCLNTADLGFSMRNLIGPGCVAFSLGTILLTILCVALLTSEAAQVMADWTFPGTNSRDGAVIGLVMCGFFPFTLLTLTSYRKAKLARQIRNFPPIADETPAIL